MRLSGLSSVFFVCGVSFSGLYCSLPIIEASLDYQLIELNILIKANNKGPSSPCHQVNLPATASEGFYLSGAFKSVGGEKLFVRDFALCGDIAQFVVAGRGEGFRGEYRYVAGRLTFVYF